MSSYRPRRLFMSLLSSFENSQCIIFDIEEDDEVEETIWTEEDGFLENNFHNYIEYRFRIHEEL